MEEGEQDEEEAWQGGAPADREPDDPASALLQASKRAVQEGPRPFDALLTNSTTR